MPFKAGDKVVVVEGKLAFDLKLNVEYTVEDYNEQRYADHGGGVRLVEHKRGGADGYICGKRFKLVEQPLVFAVGAQVERTGESTNLLDKGQQYIIQSVYRDELGGVNKIKLEGINASYHVRGFKVVANVKAAFDPAKWEPQEGEKVYIIAEDSWHSPGRMCSFINDGKEYTISRSHDLELTYQVRLDNGYVYDPRVSLRPVNAGKAVPKVAKPAPPPLELREALFKRQKANGLGDVLCSYAFETKEGKQHLYPYVCHAMLSNGHGEIVKVAYGFRHDMARVEKGKEEAHKAYSKYIISESPWASAFITQDIDEAIEKDILMNVEVNRFMIAGACVALRTGQEYPNRPVIFKEMLDLGHNPHTCWLVSCAFTKKGNTYSFNSWTGGHDVIDKYRVLDDVIKFFQTGYHIEKCPGTYSGTVHPLTKDPYRTHHGNYAIANTIANASKAKDHNDSIGAWFVNNTGKTAVGEGWDKKTVIDVKALDEVATKLDKLIKGEA